ncbi:MAG: PorT family protein [Gemmatimonadetes bacterium]|nr:PorT family protein [Gemmatimonadota bacterium]
MMNGKRLMGAVALAVTLALMTAPTDGLAQEAVVGIKGGINSYNLSWKPDSIAPDIGGQTGFVGGLFGGVMFTRVVGVQLEALYSQRSVLDQEDDVDLKTTYFEIPLLFTAKFPVGGTAIRPILFAGPSVSFESKCEVSGELEPEGSRMTFDCDDPMVQVENKKTDWALVLGVGVDYPLGKFLIGAEWRYNLGLTNLNNDSDSSSYETVKTRMWALLLTVGYPI